jgi:hypothetical protein
MAERQGSVPGDAEKVFRVATEILRINDAASIDGRKQSQAGDFYLTVNYVGTMRRRDSRFTLQLEWVDPDQKGHRVVLPHEVVTRIISVHDRIMDDAKSERAKRAMSTRISRGYVPTFGRTEESNLGGTE